MKRKALLLVALLIVAAVVPLLVLKVQADLNAGPDQEVHADETVTLNGSTTDNMTLVTQVTWDFGDGTKGYGEIVNHMYSNEGKFTVVFNCKRLRIGFQMSKA
jgi:hypothetical protein